jgi:hypothetical protein
MKLLLYIKALAGLLIELQQQVFLVAELIDAKSIGEEHMQEVTSFSEKKN